MLHRLGTGVGVYPVRWWPRRGHAWTLAGPPFLAEEPGGYPSREMEADTILGEEEQASSSACKPPPIHSGLGVSMFCHCGPRLCRWPGQQSR